MHISKRRFSGADLGWMVTIQHGNIIQWENGPASLFNFDSIYIFLSPRLLDLKKAVKSYGKPVALQFMSHHPSNILLS